MIEDMDDRIAGFLNSEAPPPRDPLFRVSVLERRERRQFQRRAYTMLAGALVIVLVSIFALSLSALAAPGVLVIGAAVATTWLAFGRRLLGILRRFSF